MATNTWQFIDAAGRAVHSVQAEWVSSAKDGAYLYRESKLLGFGSLGSGALTKPIFEGAALFREGVAGVQDSSGWYLVDRRFEPLCKERFLDVEFAGEGLWIAEISDGEFAFVAPNGKQTTKAVFEELSPFSEGLAVGRQNGKAFYIDRTGSKQLRGSFDDATEFHEARAAVGIGVQSFLIDRVGGTLAGPFDYIGRMRYGLAPVSTGGKWGYLNRDGRIVVKATYQECHVFRNGFAAVKTPKGEGVINSRGDIVFPPSKGTFGQFGLSGDGPWYPHKNSGEQWRYIALDGVEMPIIQAAVADGFRDGIALVYGVRPTHP